MTLATHPSYAWLRRKVESSTPEQLRRFVATLGPEDAAMVEQLAGELMGIASYKDDPVRFADECIEWGEGEGLTRSQRRCLRRLMRKKRLSVRALHGVGKTTLLAVVVLWFSLTREAMAEAGEITDWKLITTASAWRQLTKYLWPEVHKWAGRIRWDRLGRPPLVLKRELLDLSIKLAHGEAFAVASDDHTTIEGAHADAILYVFDESKTIPADTFDAVEGAFANIGSDHPEREGYAISVSTPGKPAGRFYDIQRRRPGLEDWNTLHITLAMAIEDGRVSRDWAAMRAKQWGVNSALYKNRVLGEFADADGDSVIPLEWVEAANERWHAWNDDATASGLVTHVGLDVARYGDDKTVFGLRCGPVLARLREYGKIPTTETTGHAKGINALWPEALFVVDVIGVGAGVVDGLREWNAPVLAFNASERTDLRDRTTGELGFPNKRSASWWALRELLDPAFGPTAALPPNDWLTGDLCAPTWRVTSGGKIEVESKDAIRKRLGRSPDHGDAVVMAFWPETAGMGAAVSSEANHRTVKDQPDLLKQAF